MTLGAGSWNEVGEIPLTSVASVYESFDQKMRLKEFQRAQDNTILIRINAAKPEQVQPPHPATFGVK